jgi:spore coat protein SA
MGVSNQGGRRRARIALICTEMLPVPPTRGGAIQTYIHGVVPYLLRQFDVTVVTIKDGALPVREVIDDVRYVRLGSNPSREDYYQEVSRFIASEPWDLIEVFNRPAYVRPIYEAANGAPIVLSLHNEMLKEKKLEPEKARDCLGLVKAVVTISRFIAKGVSKAYPEYAGKICPIRSGVDLKKFRPSWQLSAVERRAATRRVKVHNRHPVILSVSRLSEKKGVHVLIAAMKEVLKTYPTARLSIVGSRWYGENTSHPYIEKLEELARPLGEAVTFAGYVRYSDIQDYFATADLFVCASQWREPLARVHYEAMASGLPIITTKRGGNAEVMEDGFNGRVIQKYDDPAEFASAIVELLKHSDKSAIMGRYGRLLAEKHYGWKRVAKQLSAVFQSCLQGTDLDKPDRFEVDELESMA